MQGEKLNLDAIAAASAAADSAKIRELDQELLQRRTEARKLAMSRYIGAARSAAVALFHAPLDLESDDDRADLAKRAQHDLDAARRELAARAGGAIEAAERLPRVVAACDADRQPAAKRRRVASPSVGTYPVDEPLSDPSASPDKADKVAFHPGKP